MSTQAVLEDRHVERIAAEVGCRAEQVRAAARLFEGGATVPFVARYRKEATGGLDDAALEKIEARRRYCLELVERREAMLAGLREREQLTPALEKALVEAATKSDLEDLYLPYRPKRRTRAQVARERGLEPLAEALLAGASSGVDPQELAAAYVNAEAEVPTASDALAGARDILAERLSEVAETRARLRKIYLNEGRLESRVVPTRRKGEGKAAVYRDYFDHTEAAKNVPSHRLLAILRGEKEGVLRARIVVDETREIERLAKSFRVPLDGPCGLELAEAAVDGYRRLLAPSIEKQVRTQLREKAEAEAIAVFRANLESLLMQSPYAAKKVLGIDPGLRTGAKAALVDATGAVLETGVLKMLPPKADPDGAKARLLSLVREHGVEAIAIGNGTGGRDSERFVTKALADADIKGVIVTIVPETGASVYSASALAREELGDMDVSLRGAVSIARRLQDPLAELVKIEPRALGIGQYQHDVDQRVLVEQLDAAVEGVVNRVGVELNTASPALLRRVSGLGDRLAGAIVARRAADGPFKSRDELLAVPGMGPKTFELAGGFLRIREGEQPLDSTAVHPERYALVQQMAEAAGVQVPELIRAPQVVEKLQLDRFVDEERGVGRFTLDDICAELREPGRDPRPEFKAPVFRDDVRKLGDVTEGMVLEGRVSNVTNFGAFVDVGLDRDGLVHVSEISHARVADPRDAVNVGDVVNVKVVGVDLERKRLNLSMKALAQAPAGGAARNTGGNKRKGKGKGKGKGGGKPRHKPAPKGPPTQASLDALAKKFQSS